MVHWRSTQSRFFGVHIECFSRNRRHFPTVSHFSFTLELSASHLGRKRIVQALAVLRNKGIEVNKSINAIRNAIRDAGDNETAVRVAAQHHLR